MIVTAIVTLILLTEAATRRERARSATPTGVNESQ